jgi:hypothetical protein
MSRRGTGLILVAPLVLLLLVAYGGPADADTTYNPAS